MKYLIILLIAFMSFANSPVYGYDLSAPKEFNFRDTQFRFTTSDNESQFATGVCYGPFYNIHNGSSHVGEIGRVCILGAITTDKESSDVGSSNDLNTGYALSLFNIMGLTFSVAHDPFKNDVMWGMGISLMDLYNRSK